VKLPGHRPALPGEVISFHIVPLDPAYKAGLAGHVPAKSFMRNRSGRYGKTRKTLPLEGGREITFDNTR